MKNNIADEAILRNCTGCSICAPVCSTKAIRIEMVFINRLLMNRNVLNVVCVSNHAINMIKTLNFLMMSWHVMLLIIKMLSSCPNQVVEEFPDY